MKLETNDNEIVGEVCMANINTSGRRQRLILGILQFMLAIIILVVLIVMGIDRLWRLPLLLLFWSAAIGFFQWRDKTCVAFAAQGTRMLTGKIEKIEDQSELTQVRRQARKLTLKAFLVAILLMLVALVYPG